VKVILKVGANRGADLLVCLTAVKHGQRHGRHIPDPQVIASTMACSRLEPARESAACKPHPEAWRTKADAARIRVQGE
jgi:hypothetical protein